MLLTHLLSTDVLHVKCYVADCMTVCIVAKGWALIKSLNEINILWNIGFKYYVQRILKMSVISDFSVFLYLNKSRIHSAIWFIWNAESFQKQQVAL